MLWVRRIVAYLAAVATTAVLGSLASTHFVLLALTNLDVSIGIGDWLYAFGHDVVGMGTLFGVLVAVGFLIAFPVAALIARFVPKLRTWSYVGAGAVAILVIFLAMQAALETVPIAGARTPWGMAAQGLAGAVGGLVFTLLSRRSRAGSPAGSPAGGPAES